MAQVPMAFSGPLIAKLEAWGYQDALAAPLASIIGNLDAPSLTLVEKLANDLTHVNDDAYNLRAEVTAFEGKVKQEKVRLEQLVAENRRLSEKNAQLSRELDELRRLPCAVGPKDCRVEEQVQQWRAQSMHQLQELESMNQALRSTLNLHSCNSPLGSKEGQDGVIEHAIKLPNITISGQVVAPRSSSPNTKLKLKARRQKTVELVNVAEVRCKKLEDELQVLKERHAILECKLDASQKQVGNIPIKNGNKKLSGNAEQPPTTDVGVCTVNSQPKAEHVGEWHQNNMPSTNSQFDHLTADLLSLFQAYERELTALSSGHLSDAESLTRQSGHPNKRLNNGFLDRQDMQGQQEQSENGVRDFLNDLECKSKHQGIAVLCMDGNNYSTLSESPIQRMKAAREELEHKFSNYDQTILRMIKSVKEFKVQSISKVKGLKGKMDELQAILRTQESMIASLQSEVSKKNDQLNFIMDEKVVGEEALQASQLECNELASLIREIDGSMVQLTTALATRTVERDQEAEARMTTKEEVRRKYNYLMSELDGARIQVSKLQSELDLSKRRQEDDRNKAGGLNSELQECINRMENAERDVEQLKALIIQLDATREDLVAKLKGAMQSEKLAEKRVVMLDVEVRQMTEEATTRRAEISHLSSLLGALSKDRDHLQAETNLQAERTVRLTEDKTKLETEVRFLRNNLQVTEQRLQAVNSNLSQAEAELAVLKEQYSVEEATKIRLEELWTAKCSDHRAAVEELGSLTCEHQILKNDLIQLTNSHEGLMDNLRNTVTKLNHTEQELCAKGKDQEELLAMYQKTCEENQHLKQAGFELENQVQHQQYHLQGVKDMFHKSVEQARSFEEQIQHHLSELKAMERQADLMSRSLNQQSGLLNDYQSEKGALMSQLSAAKMALTDLAANLDNALREIAILQEKNQHMSARVQENMQEAERLTTSWKLEQQRVRELEHLLACVRAEEQQLEMASKGTAEQNLMMREHISVLEEQVKTLKQARDTQNQEIMRLQTSRTRSEGEDSRRFWLTGPCLSYPTQSIDTQPHQIAKDVACSKAKILELEMKIMAMTTDLSKTTLLYKDCVSKLQHAENQSLELKKEFDHVLSLLSKVDEERTSLRHQCAELERESLKHHQLSGHSSPTKSSHPEIEKMQQECHRLKKEAAFQEADSNIVARMA